MEAAITSNLAAKADAHWRSLAAAFNRSVLVVVGTRPEAIKMAPVVGALRRIPGLDVSIAVTAQHREMLDQVLALFDLVPAEDLDLMRPGQGMEDLFARVLVGMGQVIARRRRTWSWCMATPARHSPLRWRRSTNAFRSGMS